MQSGLIDVPGVWITIAGIILNFTGSLMMSIEAIGARQFLAAREEQRKTGTRMTQLAFVSTVDDAATYLLFSLLSLACLAIFDHRLGFSLHFLLSWLTYFVWVFLAKVAGRILLAIGHLSPAKVLSNWEHMGCLPSFLILLAWAPLYLLAGLVYGLMSFSFEMPLRALSEKVILPVVERLLSFIAREEDEMDRWQFKRPVFYGLVLNSIGFLMQLVGVVASLRS